MLMATLSGVYMVLHIRSDTRYVGSAARRISNRWAEHRYALRKGFHRNPKLQNAWNKYGEHEFAFVILENCAPEDCLDREAAWVEYFRDQGKPLYNLRPDARSQLGFKHTAETVARVTEKLRGKKRTPEQVETQRQRMQGVNPTWLAESRIQEWPDAVSPDGLRYSIRNLNDFCEQYGLDVSAMRKVLLGQRSNHQGWTRYNSHEGAHVFSGPIRQVGRRAVLTDPQGQTYETTNLKAFCRDHSLHSASLWQVCAGHWHHHHGWTGHFADVAPRPPTNRATKDWPDLIGPDDRHYAVESLTAFCKAHSLDKGAMQRLYKRQVRTHKGWRLAD
jgi:hypothetical protein